jgi:hypothetical protein
MIAIIDKTELKKLNPEKLFFIQHQLQPQMFIHNMGGKPELHHGFEGAAFLNEKNTEIVLKMFPACKPIPVSEMSKFLPVYLNFPEGHKLHDHNIEIRTINAPIDTRELKKKHP